MIRYSQQSIDKDDISAVIKTLKSDYITTGPNIKKFELKLSSFIGSKYSVVFNSATSALHAACVAVGLKKKDWLWTSANSFVSSANCGLYCGAKVDFIDINLNTYNIDIDILKKRLIEAKKKNKVPKVIIPIAFAGQSCEMDELVILSKKYKFKIIEDASHALGGKYKNQIIGKKKDIITIFSYHPVKMITTGEGGSAHTDNYKYYEIMKSFSSHGIYRKKKNLSSGINHILYGQEILGFNYRMTDIQASLGISQLKKINKFVKSRRKIANFYNIRLNSNRITLPKESKNCMSSYHLYVILVKNEKIRNKLIRFLKKKKIYTNIHYKPIHLQPYYKNLGFRKGDFKNAEHYYKRALSIPIHPALKKKELDKISSLINNFVK